MSVRPKLARLAPRAARIRLVPTPRAAEIAVDEELRDVAAMRLVRLATPCAAARTPAMVPSISATKQEWCCPALDRRLQVEPELASLVPASSGHRKLTPGVGLDRIGKDLGEAAALRFKLGRGEACGPSCQSLRISTDTRPRVGPSR